MELLQVVSLIASVALIGGLLKAHRVVVKKYVIPEIVQDEDLEE